MRKVKTLILLLILGLFINIRLFAYELSKDDKLYVSGESIGLKLNTGVIVVGTYGILNDNEIMKPWSDAKITDGDRIIKYGDYEIKSIDDLKKALYNYQENEVEITYLRGSKEIVNRITPAKVDNDLSLGLYIKDNIMGVGTLTYYIKDFNIFGSLGHKIIKNEDVSGDIYEATISSIKLPTRNNPGEKIAVINKKDIGDITKNTETGVHGTSSNLDTSNMELLGFKTRDEITLGKAYIWTVVEDNKVEKFEISITDLKKQNKKDIKGISFKVTDKDLIKRTGGIVQGMSGSPIVQDDKLVGAVTHVSTQDSTKGYGIYIEFMFEDMDIQIKKDS